MSNVASDILLDISDDDLPKLLKMYEEHKNCIPHVYSTILTGIAWRKNKRERYTKFMSPNGCWKEDGTFFVLFELHIQLFIFSLDDSGRNIYEGIINTKRFASEDSKELSLYAIHNKFYPIIAKALTDKGATLRPSRLHHMFSIPREEALNFNIECPTDVYIKKLDSSNVDQINSVWPHRYKNSDKYISLLIEMNDAFGVFLKSTDELVSWVVLSMLGQLIALQTAEQYKRRGYASLITKYMSKILAHKGYNPLATIVDGNNLSMNMFSKIGFKNLGLVYFTKCSM